MLKRIIQSRSFTIILLLLLIFLGMKLLTVQSPLRDLNNEAANIKQKLDEIDQKNQALTQQSSYLSSQAYLERQVRLKLNYKNPDEEAVQVYRLPVASKSDENAGVSIFRKIKDWFFSLSK